VQVSQIRTEILSGLTIAVALVPEAISFALLVGAAPQIGLWAAVFMALSTAVFGGRPGLISGATGATAVIMAGLVAKSGMDLLFLGVIVAGIIQLIIWSTSAWKIFGKIPPSAISGFLVALAIMIFTSQFRYLSVGLPSAATLSLTLATVLFCAGAMWWSAKKFSFPPALIAIAAGCIIGIPLGLSTVGDLSPVAASLPSFTLPTITLASILTVLPYSFGMAIAGLTESLLTVDTVANKLKEPGSKAKETFAQGLGNIVSGLFGSMGGCVLVGQTNLNIGAGAKHRLSGIVAAVGLILIILLFGTYIEMVPLAGLIGVMLIVVYETGDWSSLANRNPLYFVTTIATVAASLITHNLAIGIIVGSSIFYIGKLILRYDKRKQ
jgi:SulP family sulfate permease